MKNSITNIINQSIEVKQSIISDDKLLSQIDECIKIITEAFKRGNKVIFCGNGGSAADAQHLAAEFSGRFYIDRKALPSEALHCNASYLTAVANDYSYDVIYSRLVEGIGRSGDVLIGITTSGNSKNIINAINKANELSMFTIGFTGKAGGALEKSAMINIKVSSDDTPRVQECHIMIGHIICEFVERNMFI
jgi:D-sedoheptulose 7-phosphate isomerase